MKLLATKQIEKRTLTIRVSIENTHGIYSLAAAGWAIQRDEQQPAPYRLTKITPINISL